ncbi:hypothetical protein [Mycobacterium sp. PSTR-4-N]|uniref:hypothetical protein n=1 Tax=Mycobacterium sp. PSTR-4-N TaxID=2917745 RepID=UPI001F14F46E|nr:hypothetical protein [Mycobacterium sp. PSTR-4-N]MCG7594592.1 hypothetical protein [Mycobacterium sp. PSTR-4-N]
MAKLKTLDRLTAAVVQAELIPTNRPLTTGEIELLDDINAQLRPELASHRGEVIGLLRRVSAVRRNRETGVSASATHSQAAKKPVKVQNSKAKGTSIGQIHAELSQMATTQKSGTLGRKRRERLNKIINDAAKLTWKGPQYKRLYERALQIQEKDMRPSRPKRSRRVGPSGLVQNPGLSEGGREVLGGLPSSRRGH